MTHNLIKFFITKARLNYFIFILLIILGFISYQTIPKDVFPTIQIDIINVSGSYTGASIDTLNNMIVADLEKEFKTLTGVDKIESYIKSNSFNIVITLIKGKDKNDLLIKVKSIVDRFKVNLPTDMNDPIATIVDLNFPLIDIIISIKGKYNQKLIEYADQIKNEISTISNISKINMINSTNKVFEIILDEKKIELYGLNKNILFQKIKELSNIYPLGKIEGLKNHIYLSTENGKKISEEYLKTLIKVGDKSIYLEDIAKIRYKFKQTDILSKINGKFAIKLRLFKDQHGDAIKLIKTIKDKIKILNKKYTNVNLTTFNDTSILIKNRLNTVVSGILIGLILLTIAMYILINKRVAFIVMIGIPTAILIGLIVLSFTSYTINMITLIGTLLILGVLVDDAVIVAENIQRHIMMGDDKLDAAINGTKEVLIPVLASSATTIFAFMPMMMLSGIMGQFLLMIPVAVIILVFASLIESFIFLPIHSLDILNSKHDELDWGKAQKLYKKILYFLSHHKKTFLFMFLIGVPALTVLLIMNSKFQLFPDFEGDKFFIKGKFNANHTYLETYQKTKIIEEILLKHKKKFFIKKISYLVGQREDNRGRGELRQSVFHFSIELFSHVPTNILDKYVAPIFTINNNNDPEIRTIKTLEIVEKIKKLINKDFNSSSLSDFVIGKPGTGVTKNHIEIQITGRDKKIILTAIKEIKSKLGKINGVISISDSASLGAKELTLKINSHGESLGFTEKILLSAISPIFLKSEQSKGLNNRGVFKIISYGSYIKNLKDLEDFEINIPNSNQKIFLSEISNFSFKQNFDLVKKLNENIIQEVFVNLNQKIITSEEVLNQLKTIFNKYKKQNLSINLGGDSEVKHRSGKELMFAMLIAISLIFITLLIMFNSFRITLIIISIIPLSVLGAIVGHFIMGVHLSILSIMGILGLAGVVINNAIIMVEFLKNAQTLTVIIEQAVIRLRPIFITSITTFLGLSTLIFFASGQSKILQPMALSLGFGLLWGTVLTLTYLPILYILVKRIKT